MSYPSAKIPRIGRPGFAFPREGAGLGVARKAIGGQHECCAYNFMAFSIIVERAHQLANFLWICDARKLPSLSLHHCANCEYRCVIKDQTPRGRGSKHLRKPRSDFVSGFNLTRFCNRIYNRENVFRVYIVDGTMSERRDRCVQLPR